MGDIEAALRLVEAGASWQRSKDQRSDVSGLSYAPDILHSSKPQLKVRWRSYTHVSSCCYLSCRLIGWARCYIVQ
jgi:hypothetical protein